MEREPQLKIAVALVLTFLLSGSAATASEVQTPDRIEHRTGTVERGRVPRTIVRFGPVDPAQAIAAAKVGSHMEGEDKVLEMTFWHRGVPAFGWVKIGAGGAVVDSDVTEFIAFAKSMKESGDAELIRPALQGIRIHPEWSITVYPDNCADSTKTLFYVAVGAVVIACGTLTPACWIAIGGLVGAAELAEEQGCFTYTDTTWGFW